MHLLIIFLHITLIYNTLQTTLCLKNNILDFYQLSNTLAHPFNGPLSRTTWVSRY